MKYQLAYSLFFALFLLPTTGAQSLPESPSQQGTAPQFHKPANISDERVYGLFFLRVARLNELESSAASDTPETKKSYVIPYLQKRLQVTDAQAADVNQIALQLKDSLAQQDAQAREIRTKRHIEVQTKRAQNLPAPSRPAALTAIPAQRTALILAARDQLRNSLGSDSFARLDAGLKAPAATRKAKAVANLANDQSNTSEEDRTARKNRLAYRAFLHQVIGFKARAAQERSMGLSKTADGYSTEVQRLASLNDEQARIVDEIATDYSNKLDPCVKQYRELHEKYGQRWLALSSTGVRASDDQELGGIKGKLKQVHGQIDELTDTAIQHLQQRLGQEEFGRLDAFVKQPVKRLPLQSPESSAIPAVPKLEAAR